MGSVAGTAEACGCSGPVQISFRATGRSSKVAKAKTEMITDLHVALINLNYSTTVQVWRRAALTPRQGEYQNIHAEARYYS